MRSLPILFSIFRIYVRQSFHHRTAAAVTVLMWSLRTMITIILYAAIYKMMDQSSIRNITYEVAISAMLLSAIYSGFAPREVAWQINGENKSGLLEVWVNKPLAYIGLKIAEVTGRNIPAVLGLVVMVLLFWLGTHHFPQVDRIGWRLLAGVFLLLCGLSIAICIYVMAGLTSLYLQDARPVNLLVDRIILIFSGAFIPIGFLPHWFRLAGELLPTGSAVYMTQIFYPDFFVNLPRFALTQLIWLLVCGFGVRAFYRKASHHLVVNGG